MNLSENDWNPLFRGFRHRKPRSPMLSNGHRQWRTPRTLLTNSSLPSFPCRLQPGSSSSISSESNPTRSPMIIQKSAFNRLFLSGLLTFCFQPTSAGESDPNSSAVQQWKKHGDRAIEFLEVGDYRNAEQHLRIAVGFAEINFGSGDTRLGTTLYLLGRSLCEQRRFIEAEPLLRRGLAIQVKALGRDHIDLVEEIHDLGVCLCSVGRTAEAEKLFRRELAIREKAAGQDHVKILNVIQNLGRFLNSH